MVHLVYCTNFNVNLGKIQNWAVNYFYEKTISLHFVWMKPDEEELIINFVICDYMCTCINCE